jgi:hypothetical protein
MVAGDTVTVSAGTYSETVTQTTNGTSGSRIIYIAAGAVTVNRFLIDGSYVTIDGFTITTTTTDWRAAVWANSTGVTVQNCTFTGNTGTCAVLFYTGSNGCILDNCTIKNGYGQRGMVSIYGTNNTVSNCDFSSPNQSDDRDAIHVFGTGHVISGNYFHGWSWPAGTPHMDMIQTWTDAVGGNARNILVENNLFIIRLTRRLEQQVQHSSWVRMRLIDYQE